MDATFQKRVPDEFGLIIPRENNIEWIKQGGGFSCIQKKLEGVYVPIGQMRYNLGYPDWSPESPEFEQKLQSTDLNDLSETDRSHIPENILKRGYFESADEYLNWVDESEMYGWITLWDDLQRFTYGVFENLDSDPRNRWDSVEELWDAIDNTLDFKYEEISPDNYGEYNIESYPRPEASIRPIVITDGTNKGRYQTDWSSLEGEAVFLMCPNAD